MQKRSFLVLLFTLTLVLTIIPTYVGYAVSGVTLHTPYSGISLTPGEKANMQVEVLNNSTSIKHVNISVRNLPEDWNHNITSGGYAVNSLSVKPDDSEIITLDVEVPLRIDKGSYEFQMVAEADGETPSFLPITINVNERGVFQTELTTKQPNMEGDSDASFTYDLELYNRTAEEQHYALRADAPRGWTVDFKVNGSSVTSVAVNSNARENIKVELHPSEQVKEGTYEVPITASAGQTESSVKLEAHITGSYGVELTTPDGRLSETIVAGKEKTMKLEVKNTGTTTLRQLSLSSNTPPNWDVTFDSETIDSIEPGESQEVRATIHAAEKAIAGDYVVEMSVSSPEASSNSQFRMSVKTSSVWGWIGVLIIIAVVIGIYYLVRKYGRR
ncbi:COG1470 family protein [Salirhabdus salicampi]|uniref:COG1470 family protein n=1 Tax=Salirhabdus salicampi TaxID=476102 RepID=UPI0020C2CF62|nr:NEW3 domain-containing protein [Salirhabdus salicampi]MCP8615504.1 NEW3 domain-containing protein [Salirhabdus salicampi]